jgi:acid phosphatase
LETALKTFAVLLGFFLGVCGIGTSWGSGGTLLPDDPAAAIAWPAGLPVYDHVVLVVEENKDYDQIIDNPKAPYINFTLREEGANFTHMFGEEHNSQGNYFWLFSGSNQTVGFKDKVPTQKSHANYPFKAPNLGAALIAKGRSFKGYAEDLPAIGSAVEFTTNTDKENIYARKPRPVE